MRLVAINRIESGAILGRDVHTGRNSVVPLLARGVRLEARYLASLKRAGIHAVYIEDELSAGIEVEPALSAETRHTATVGLHRAFAQARRGIESNEPVSDSTIGELASIVQLIADAIADCNDAVLALQDLAAADAYTLQHSIDVAAVGLLVARQHAAEWGWIDYRGTRRWDKLDSRFIQLGIGLMLHDIGKLMVPTEILTKPGPLDAAEMEVMRKHPMAGLDLLSPASVGPLARSVIRSHHERWDGSGYPEARSGPEIHQFARIAAVADVYDAVTSERPYSAARPPHHGWHLVVGGAGTLFDAEVVSAFRRTVAPYPPGAEIVLDDGRRGVVAVVKPDALERPLVRIGWDAAGTPVTPYEIQLDTLPGAAELAA
jgi:HD-GYP domain-containing protein (c-di-GMP phosphodiesterase class II)